MDDTLPSSTAKRHCPLSASSLSSSSSSSLSPSMFPNRIDQLLVSFLARADSPSFPLSLDCSFDRVLASASIVTGGNADEERIINCARNLGSLLIESADRYHRKRAAVHNSISWPLSPDLTTRVLAMLDTRTVICAAATCSMFRNCAMDPFCYSHITLTSDAPKVNNAVVSTMIQRAGYAVRSLKLGIVRGPTGPSLSRRPLAYVPMKNGRDLPILTRSCLNPLWTENGAVGKHLRKLHLYNIELMDTTSLCCAVSACRNLTDLKIVGIYAGLKQVLEAVTKYCHLIVHLFFEVCRIGRDDCLKASDCEDFVNNCRNLSSLTLRGFELEDTEARIFLEGSRKLKYLDLSRTSSITGLFLRNLGNRHGDSVLETLILRDCADLMEGKVVQFLTSLFAGDFKFLRHIDVSNRDGLSTDDGWRSCQLQFPLAKLKEERPELRILARFPVRPSVDEISDPLDATTSESSCSSSSHESDGYNSSESNDSAGTESSEEDDDMGIKYEHSFILNTLIL